jgi:hypothetical protein
MFAMVALPAGVQASDNFAAPLSGGQEVPARDTNATGVATFKFNKDATEFSFKVIASNIDNVFAAHIHCGAAGVNGPVGVTLYMGTPAGGRFVGVLSEGVKTAPDAGNACGWETVADVLEAMNSGNTYVNVHTNDGIDPPNTGAGDFPGGEIRGQIY